MSLTGWIILLIANIPVYFGIGWIFFPTLDDFWEAIKFWLTPDFISMFRGEYWVDRWAELKLFFWILSCIACVFGEIQLIDKYLK